MTPEAAALLKLIRAAFPASVIVLDGSSPPSKVFTRALQGLGGELTWTSLPSEMITGHLDTLLQLEEHDYLTLLPAWLAYASKNPVGPVARGLLAHLECSSPGITMTQSQRPAVLAVPRHMIMFDDRGGPLNPRGHQCWLAIKQRWAQGAA